MIALTLALLLTAQPYDDAVTKLYADGTPILLLVTMDNCGPCMVQKQTLTAMDNAGQLRGVSWVNLHRRHDAGTLAKLRLNVRRFPALVLVYYTKQGWRFDRAGMAPAEQVGAMIRRAGVR